MFTGLSNQNAITKNFDSEYYPIHPVFLLSGASESEKVDLQSMTEITGRMVVDRVMTGMGGGIKYLSLV